MHGAGDYLILHNVACIHAELSRQDPKSEDLALDVLQRAVELWRRQGTEPKELNLIKGEKAFPKSLRDRPEFQKLLDGNSPP
jgi:hypothetical protein